MNNHGKGRVLRKNAVSRIAIKAQLKAGIKFDEEANVFVAYIPTLELYSQGETQAEARTAMEDAVHSYLLVAYKNGVFNDCMQNLGLTTMTELDHSRLTECEEFISVKEKAMFEKKRFSNIFEIPASLALCGAQALSSIIFNKIDLTIHVVWDKLRNGAGGI